MGQYYHIVMKDGLNMTYNSRNVTGIPYIDAKITEHSWLGNVLMDSVSAYIFGHKTRILWLGDYVEQDEVDKITNCEVDVMKSFGDPYLDYKEVELNNGENRNPLVRTKFSYGGKYLVNHTKKVAVSFSDYRKNHYISRAKWVQHPLSLLTAVGNGEGNGDYHGVNEDFVGSWAWDEVSIERRIPLGYEKVDIWFKEDFIEDWERETLEKRKVRMKDGSKRVKNTIKA